MITAERILADAEIAATFLRALVDKGIPMAAAVQLTGGYLSSHQIAEAMKDKPKEPWEGEP